MMLDFNYPWAKAIAFFCLLGTAVYQVKGEIVIDGTRNLKRDSSQGVAYAKFFTDSFHFLNTTPLLTVSVNELRECAGLCVDHFSCFSFNGAATRDLEGKLLCELLPSDKYNKSAYFTASQKFHHFSIKVGRPSRK